MLWKKCEAKQLIPGCAVPGLYIDNVQEMSCPQRFCPQRWKFKSCLKTRKSKFYFNLHVRCFPPTWMQRNISNNKKFAVILEKIKLLDQKRCGQDKVHLWQPIREQHLSIVWPVTSTYIFSHCNHYVYLTKVWHCLLIIELRRKKY